MGIAKRLKSVVLHIGTEKTGSTSLQSYLLSNEPALNEGGYSYFCSEDRPYFESHAHFPLVACFSPDTPDYCSEEKHSQRSKVLETIQRDIGESPFNAILSAEHFSSRLHDTRDLGDLRSALRDFDVKVVVYLRPQHELLTSSYFTGVMSGRRTGLSVDDAQEDNYYFNYEAMLHPYAEVFGKQNISVRDFKSTPDVRADFLSIVGISHLASSLSRLADFSNRSAPPAHVEIIRMVNDHLAMFGESSHREYRAAGDVRSRILKALPVSPGSIGQLLSIGEKTVVSERFKSSNARLEREYLQPGAFKSWHNLEDASAKVRPMVGNSELLLTLATLAEQAESEVRQLHLSLAVLRDDLEGLRRQYEKTHST